MLRAVLWCAACAAAAGQTTSWPQFRGPNGSGIAAEPSDPPVEFAPNKNVLWKTALPSGHSSPSIWGDRVFVTGFDQASRTLEVLAVHRSTGKILWRRAVPASGFEEVHTLSSLATATPAIDGERVYAYFGSAGIFCFDLDGQPLWSIPLPVAHVIPHGSGTSLIVVDGKAILNRDEVPDSYLLAVDGRTGRVVWKQKQYLGEPERRNGSKATPVVWRDGDRAEIVLHRRGEIVGYDLATGVRKWWVRAETQGAGTPVVGPHAIYVGTWFNDGEPDLLVPLPDFDSLLKQYDRDGDGALSVREFPDKVAVAHRIGLDGVEGADNARPSRSIFAAADTNKNGKIERGEWDAYVKGLAAAPREHGLLAIRPGGSGDVTATHVLWKEPSGVPEVPAPLYYRERVYMVAGGGVVTCLEAATGRRIYRGRLGAGGAYFSSPVAAHGRIYFASNEGVVTVIGGGDTLEVLARNALEEPLFATPAVVGGVIYIRTPKFLFAFEH